MKSKRDAMHKICGDFLCNIFSACGEFVGTFILHVITEDYILLHVLKTRKALSLLKKSSICKENQLLRKLIEI